MPCMMKLTLPLALLGLLLIPSCRHQGGTSDSHEEALPVSHLPHAEFSKVTPQRGRR